MRKWLALLLLVAGIGFLAYFSTDFLFIEEDGPESFTINQGDGCTDHGDGMVTCEDSIPWEPYCLYYEDQYGTYSECYEYEGGEPLCPYGDGPFWDAQGDPYFVATWDYCMVLEGGDPDDFTIPFIDYTIDDKVMGTVTSGGMIPLGLKVVGVLRGNGKVKKMGEALDELKEELQNAKD